MGKALALVESAHSKASGQIHRLLLTSVRPRDQVFEITDLTIDGVDLNFEKGKGLGHHTRATAQSYGNAYRLRVGSVSHGNVLTCPSNVKAMLDYMEANLLGVIRCASSSWVPFEYHASAAVPFVTHALSNTGIGQC
eukprot:5974181-Amphidinium_carterae.2